MHATAPLLFSTTELTPAPHMHLVAPAHDERYESLRRPCPACGLPGLRIVYGVPSAALVDAARRGEVLLGGTTHRAATHRCPYGYEWHAPDAAW